MNPSKILHMSAVCLLATGYMLVAPSADTAVQTLPFSQDWADPGLITVDDDWSGVPGVIGYRGDGLTSGTGVNPQIVVADGSAVVDVNANQTTPNTLTTGGVSEFAIANPAVALQGSGTADAPHLVITVHTSGLSNVTVQYNLRDLDGSADNAISPVALQFRVGTSGPFTNVPAGFVADATTGPSAATLVTAVSALLPAAAANQAVVQIRIITTDAAGSDEWIGIDDISVTGQTTPQPTNPTGVGGASPSSVVVGGTSLLTVAVTPGQNPASSAPAVSADLTAIGGPAAQTFFDDGTHGDAAPGDLTFSFLSTVAGGTTAGPKTIGATITDGEGRSNTASIALDVFVPTTSVVISQVYGGGGNSGAPYRNDFIELYNRGASAVDLSTWSVQYASAGGSIWSVTPLVGFIQPGGHYLVWEASGSNQNAPLLPPFDAMGTIAMAAGDGKVILSSSTTALTGSCPAGAAVVDLVGYGSANCFEGVAAAPTLSNTTAAIRIDPAVDTNRNHDDFVAGTPNPHNSQGQPPTGTGAAMPASLDSGDTSLLTVTVTPGQGPASTGLAVTADLQAINGSATQPFFDDGTNGDLTAGDRVFSFSTVVTGTSGSKSIIATISDAQGRSTTTTFFVTIQSPPIAINVVQGGGSRSAYEGQTITTIGIVTALRTSSFYIQTPNGLQDSDGETSEGLLVFTGFPRPAGIARGDLVKVAGRVVEFVPAADPASPPITELGAPISVTVLSRDNPLPAPVSLLPAYTSPAGNFEQLERFEGMRIVANIQAISGTDSFTITDADEENATSRSNGDFYAVLNGIARPMREVGLEQSSPVAAPATVPRWDENPERLRVDSNGQENAPSIEIVAGQTIDGLIGVLDYGFRSYTIVPDPQVWTPAGSAAARPVPAANANEFTVAAFNMERFFDDQDDPIDEPVLTPAAFDKRLAKASFAIRNVLGMPDILGVEEVENISTLRRLADRINADAAAEGNDPQYQAYLEEGNDIGGIDSGFLVKASRVTVNSVVQVGKLTTYVEPDGDTAILNDRPPLVLEASIGGTADYPLLQPYPVTVIVNHLRSLSGIGGSDGARIRRKRQQQAEFLASYIQARQTANRTERIVSVGDYNAFQVNDGYVDVIGTIIGQPTPSAQVLISSLDLVQPDLLNLGNALGSEQYSFVFDGNAQTLDHIIVNQRAHGRVTRMTYARSNADFPESFRGDPTRPERLSDHDMPVAYFALPGAPVITLNGQPTMTIECSTPFNDPGASAVDEEAGALVVTVTGAVDSKRCGSYTLIYTASNGFTSASVTRTVNVVDRTAPALVLNGAAEITIEAGAAWVDPGASATDTCAGDLAGAIGVMGTVNALVPGSYTLTYSVSDGFNTTTATRVVRVVDTTAPALSALVASPSTLGPPNHQMVDITLTYTVTDLTGLPVCAASVTSSEPQNFAGDGNTPVDWQVLGPQHVRLRAERSGWGDGRVYAIRVVCNDAFGNATQGTTTVVVPR